MSWIVRLPFRELPALIGMITEVAHANEIITGAAADLVFLARELLRQPYEALGAEQ